MKKHFKSLTGWCSFVQRVVCILCPAELAFQRELSVAISCPSVSCQCNNKACYTVQTLLEWRRRATSSRARGRTWRSAGSRHWLVAIMETLLDWSYRAGQQVFDRGAESHHEMFGNPELYNCMKESGYFATVRIFGFSSSKSQMKDVLQVMCQIVNPSCSFKFSCRWSILWLLG